MLSKYLSHFHVTSGYPRDLAHDLSEGMTPVEFVHCCFSLLISKQYFTFEKCNNLIQNFEYKWAEKTNRPHATPHTFSFKLKKQKQKKQRWNAHESWALL